MTERQAEALGAMETIIDYMLRDYMVRCVTPPREVVAALRYLQGLREPLRLDGDLITAGVDL